MSAHPPIIIIGMSRSGTGMLVKMLEDLGLFIGKSKDRNNEALFFIDLNMWLLEQSSGGLENPQSIKYIIMMDKLDKPDDAQIKTNEKLSNELNFEYIIFNYIEDIMLNRE